MQFGKFSPNVEVAALCIRIYKELMCFGSLMEDMFSRHNIDINSSQEWFPLQNYLDFTRDVSETFGDATIFHIGRNVITEAIWPPQINSLWEALSSINTAYHMNHRGDAEIGYYAAEWIAENKFEVTCCNPYPFYFDVGIIRGICNKFGGSTTAWRINLKPNVGAHANNANFRKFEIVNGTDEVESNCIEWVNNESLLLNAILSEAYSAINQMADELHQQSRKLALSNSKYQRLINNLGDRFVVFITKQENHELIYVSDGFESVFGLPREQVLNQPFTQIINWSDESTAKMNENALKLAAEEFTHQHQEYSFSHPNGQDRCVMMTSHLSTDENGVLLNEGIIENVTYRKKMELQLEKAATLDGLTSLLNRSEFGKRFTAEFIRARRHARNLSVLMLDLDHFKKVNDQYGHQAGDEVLRHFASIILKEVRQNDLAGRYGGEEFIIALPETSVEDARILAERIRFDLQSSVIEIDEFQIKVSVSIGIASVTDDCDSTEEVIARADKALYTSKSLGRNRTELFVP